MEISTQIGILLNSSVLSIQLFFLTLLFSLPLGLVIAIGRMSKYKIISIPVKIYQVIMRGTPLLLQLIFVYYIMNSILKDYGIIIQRFPAAVIAFVLNYAAYFSEIYRGGIESMPQGQYEAAKTLGYTRSQTFVRIIFPQVIKRILPPMCNEFMTLVKDTSLAQVIAVSEIFYNANSIASTTYTFTPIFIAGVIYLLMNFIVQRCFDFAEKKLNYYR
ncbi:MAG: polar amino acid ABC transporter permease [Clostridiales bacterium 43-6]|nr:MAG: polar amino acid ABC transporter permease [Clostridiales bacterium 43-6]